MVMMKGRATSPDSLEKTMWIHVLKGCVGDGQTVATGEKLEIRDVVGNKLIERGMAEEIDPPATDEPPKKKAAKKKAAKVSDDTGNG